MFKFFERLTKPFPSAEPTQPPQGIFQFCRHYTKGMERPLIIMSLLTALMAVIEVSLFGFMGNTVDWLTQYEPDAFFAAQWPTLLALGIVLVVILPLLVWLHSNITHQSLLGNYPMSIRWRAHQYLLKQSIGFYQNDFAGRVATKVMQTSLAVRETVMKLMDVLLYITIYFISALILLAMAHYWLMLVMVVWLIGYSLIQYYFLPRLKRISAAQADARSLMTGRIVDSYSNIATVKLFAHTDSEAQYAKESMSGFLETVYGQMRLVTLLSFCVQALNYSLVFVTALTAIYLWTQGQVSPGETAIAISLALRLNGMSQWIMWEISSLFENIGAVADGATTLSKPREVLDCDDATPIKIHSGKIEFSNVAFHYGKAAGVLEQFNLTIQPGEKIGLVGKSGAGKSTLVNLLLRFYDVESGEILIDEQPIKLAQQESLRAQIGMVTQDTSLLHRSVRENILYGRPEATEQELWRAIQLAEADEFIAHLEDPHGNKGLDAEVGERGVKLSGGQRQRIAIARVLLKDAPILVLDEATSALDSEVEAAIQSSLEKLMQGKTVIAIAHRLSTIAAMDRLVVLDQGQIVEQGSHHELLQKNGVYAQLWAHQTGGFLGES
ncbi:MAG: ABC transporter ATP-binding protein [Gammaproteobacteria bacterium]|nr:ABC transporter ATP-binding protein [Gammaproteobacteria bacterium]